MFVSIRVHKRIFLFVTLVLAAAIIFILAGVNPIQAAGTSAAKGIRLPVIKCHGPLEESSRQSLYACLRGQERSAFSKIGVT